MPLFIFHLRLAVKSFDENRHRDRKADILQRSRTIRVRIQQWLSQIQISPSKSVSSAFVYESTLSLSAHPVHLPLNLSTRARMSSGLNAGNEHRLLAQANAAAFSSSGYSTSGFGSGPSRLSHQSIRL